MIKRKHLVNESAFDSVSEESAYWIGFLIADGTITVPTPKQPTPSVRLQLAVCDLGHLEKFRAFLGSTHKISQGKTSKGTQAAVLAINSWKLVTALHSFGVVNKKSHTAKVIGLESDRNFWRGAVDGDGSIWLSKQGRACLSFCGSRAMVEQFINFVRLHAPACRVSVCRNGPIYKTGLTGRYATKMIDVLYSGCSVALARKQQRAIEFLSLCKDDLKPKPKIVPARKRRKLAGQCPDCGARPESGKTRCAAHMATQAMYGRNSYRKRFTVKGAQQRG